MVKDIFKHPGLVYIQRSYMAERPDDVQKFFSLAIPVKVEFSAVNDTFIVHAYSFLFDKEVECGCVPPLYEISYYKPTNRLSAVRK